MKLFLSMIFLTGHLFAVTHFEFPADGELTSEMQIFYQDNGFLIFDNYLTKEECDSLSAETNKLINEFVPTPETTALFAAKNEGQEDRGRYFEDSADKISFFFEEQAFVDGKLIVDKIDGINKIGHALGECNDKFHAVTFRNTVRRIAEQLGVSDPRLNQSMLICKPKHIGGEVSPHQDSTFLYTEPNTTLAFWMPLEDANLDNACLWGIPGSHEWDLLTRYVKKPNGSGFITQDKYGNSMTYSEISELYNTTWLENDFVALTMKKGALIVFPGTFVHKSNQNFSDKSRRAYTFHLISGHSNYPSDNWLQRNYFAPIE